MVLSHFAGQKKGATEIEIGEERSSADLPLSLKYADLIARTRKQVSRNAEQMIHKQTTNFEMINQTKPVAKSIFA